MHAEGALEALDSANHNPSSSPCENSEVKGAKGGTESTIKEAGAGEAIRGQEEKGVCENGAGWHIKDVESLGAALKESQRREEQSREEVCTIPLSEQLMPRF